MPKPAAAPPSRPVTLVTVPMVRAPTPPLPLRRRGAKATRFQQPLSCAAGEGRAQRRGEGPALAPHQQPRTPHNTPPPTPPPLRRQGAPAPATITPPNQPTQPPPPPTPHTPPPQTPPPTPPPLRRRGAPAPDAIIPSNTPQQAPPCPTATTRPARSPPRAAPNSAASPGSPKPRTG